MQDNRIPLKPSQVTAALRSIIAFNDANPERHLVPMLWSPPGVGKSALVNQLAADLQRLLEDVRATSKESVDFRGLPAVSDGITRWTRPEDFPAQGSGIYFLDEVNSAQRSVLAVLYQVVLDHACGPHRLGGGWSIICAGNYETDGGVTEKMPTPLRSRMVHYDVVPDLDDLCAYALAKQWPIEVVAFLRFRPDLLHQFDKQQRSFPCPRTWEFVARSLEMQLPPDLEHATVAGAVGAPAAAEFIGFLRVFRTLPTPDAILLSPGTADVPSDVATLCAICGALARRANPNTIGAIKTYADRMPDEYAVFMMQAAIQNDKAIQTTPSMVRWFSDHAGVLI